MSDDPWARLESRPCRCLRSKEMFYDNGIPLDQRSGSGIFWCSQTQNCIGPDGRIVSPEECVSARPCHER